ncbi:Hypothetical protein R9X50_00562600 [Acrodontium crateriforme]|uniref:Uncharacterized protein n=1 Tax=Acrodontium crateriforme TaxID=150365 RepID=A0AAQ3RDA8_9PEZI|nr:Hypothetical protein R9X50_00562600 [Acrodontium crateriforme]
MENHTSSASGDLHSKLMRIHTSSTSQHEPEVDYASSPAEAMRFPWSSQDVQPIRPTPHRRPTSGSLLSRLNFLRSPTEETVGDDGFDSVKTASDPIFRKSIDDDEPVISPTSPNDESAMSMALKSTKTRKRKGSLRKTALLGRRPIPDARERRSGLLQRSPSARQTHVQPSAHDVDAEIPVTELQKENMSSQEPENRLVPPRNGFEYDPIPKSMVHGWSEPNGTSAHLSLVTGVETQGQSSQELSSPSDAKSPASVASYTSTDDDDILTFNRPSAFQKPQSSAATAFFPDSSEASLPIRTHASGTSLSKHTHSPLAHTISSAASSLYPVEADTGHDYTETEFWGWVILFVTWLTFTVGMGSCLELWSWAWDVGETPYAPPELEDDPTLPIVGYYPALIVLTGVVAWVWITVAWVGMKYFRHAKIEV